MKPNQSARLRQCLPYRESEREPRPSERGVEGRDFIERGRRDGRAQPPEWKHGIVTGGNRGDETSEKGV